MQYIYLTCDPIASDGFLEKHVHVALERRFFIKSFVFVPDNAVI